MCICNDNIVTSAVAAGATGIAPVIIGMSSILSVFCKETPVENLHWNNVFDYVVGRTTGKVTKYNVLHSDLTHDASSECQG